MSESICSFEQSRFVDPPKGPCVVDNDDKKTTEFMLSIAVISTADLAKSLKEALLERHKACAEPYKLYVHIAERMKVVLRNRSMHVDFFIMLADPRRADAAEKITTDLSRLSTAFLTTGRCVIAVSWPKETPALLVANCSTYVHKVCKISMLHKVVQPEDSPTGKRLLADGLLRLARTARGLNATGIPNFTTCFNPGPHWVSPIAETAMHQPDSSDDDYSEEND